MANEVACPTCGTPMREIVWGYGTIADVADAGDVVIGGCVIDVDTLGRVAALQCPACGTRADAQGVALERPDVPATTEHPFAVSFSNPLPSEGVVTMTDEAQPLSGQGTDGADASPFVEEDFGGIASGGDWRDHVEPYASREDQLPEPSAPSREHVEPYASREDPVPERSAPSPERVEPYASREDPLPGASASAPDRVDPYASREDPLPQGDGGWRDRIDAFAADPASQGVPGEAIDAHSLDTSEFTDAEEEGWPPPRGE
ncbi:hypothetical protein [Agrococcus sp. ARC_14]|uniref:hypothetical protein n=1 Tax=Agrococcus sp. ARC_14 TaxID=2919927 RepID=UPI001F053B22|nr:hypothetical protein [Agrococcus sp. ARC_14]MCH1881703.1 hypothetical protein [Agrococcus sp. ARC_14]